jgi:hypothetical protein
MLQDNSQRNGYKLVDVAEAIVDSHLLLLQSPSSRGTPSERPGRSFSSPRVVCCTRQRLMDRRARWFSGP